MSVVDCEWSDWQIGQCSLSCGGGTRTNIRLKTSEEKNGGICEGEPWVQEDCNSKGCPGKFNLYPVYLICQFWFIGYHIKNFKDGNNFTCTID